MVELIVAVIAAFLSGFAVKIVDWIDDERKKKTPDSIRYAIAIIYGLLIGYVIGNATFAMIFLAALIAQVFAKKIDTKAHQLGFLVAAISLFWFGFPELDLPLFVFFAALAFLDEIDFLGKLHPITEYRLLLKIAALVPLAMGRIDYFIGIIAFDLGYLGFQALSKNIK